jgi:hypothetical protein
MVIESPPLQNILQTLSQLSEELRQSDDPPKRLAVLRQMRMLLGDADKIVDSEMATTSMDLPWQTAARIQNQDTTRKNIDR